MKYVNLNYNIIVYMKLFIIKREIDNTGLSGCGIIAQGVEFDNGKCVLCWLGKISTLVIHENIESIKKINCSHSKSKIIYIS